MGEVEIWKDIEGFEGLYQVSNFGKVKSLNYRRSGKERIMKLRQNRGGYLQVNLSKNGKMKSFRVHRLVALAFLENDNPTEKTQINHIDENPSNNHVSNLEWCTQRYNNCYGFKT